MNMIHRKTRDFVVPLLCRYLVILEGPHVFPGWFFGERSCQAGSLLAQGRLSWTQGDAMSGLVLHPRKQGTTHQRIKQSQQVTAV